MEWYKDKVLILKDSVYINLELLDLVVMPGVAFTLDGKRLGHGKGYYDSFLHEYAEKCNGNFPKTVALALTIQILEDLPMSERDVPVNQIIYSS